MTPGKHREIEGKLEMRFFNDEGEQVGTDEEQKEWMRKEGYSEIQIHNFFNHY